MRFHLNYTPNSSSKRIDHQNKLMLVGSCFAENIGMRLLHHHFEVLMNPNGILFNPLSISHTLKKIILNQEIDTSIFLQKNTNQFFSLLHHSSIYGKTSSEFEVALYNTQNTAHNFIKQANQLIITFGSAFVYFHKELNIPVANCHKLPNHTFEKKLLKVDEIVVEYADLITKLKAFNSKINLIFTVSPVKYLKDGVEENNLSKATLLLAINELKQKFEVDYFPAYELVIDDLRDYRFYKEDMAHPNDAAIKYVWEKFSDTYFTEETKKLNSELHSINTSEEHKLLFPESEEAKKFRETLDHKKRELKSKFSFLKF